ncbi:MAG TPA: preprotein translocase subunit SecG [Gammaproteobacteria bacterium]|nr:preprotein translocase subunit SecG [Gammaproteobacteria bacterium]
MFVALLILQVLLGVAIIGLVLLQQGKGADMGAAFGAGASGTVFGAKGGGSFLTRTTAILAAAFFANSILLSSPLVREVRQPTASVVDRVETGEQAPEEAPAAEKESGEAESDLPPVDLPEVPKAEGEESDLPPAEEPKAAPAEEKANAPAKSEAGQPTAADKASTPAAGKDKGPDKQEKTN